MLFAAKMKFEGLTSVSTVAHLRLLPRNSSTENGTRLDSLLAAVPAVGTLKRELQRGHAGA
jgi:hypothetical protein